MLILTYLVYEGDQSYYLETLLEQCKFLVKNKETKILITENLFISEDETEDESKYKLENETFCVAFFLL